MRRRNLARATLLASLASAAACHDGPGVRRVPALASIEPAALDFGPVPVGEWRQAQLHVKNLGEVPFRATQVLNLGGDPSFSTVAGDVDIPAEGEGDVTVRFHPLGEGPRQGAVQVSTDADQNAQRVVTLSGLGTPTPIEVQPSSLDFQTLEVQSQRTLNVTVTNPVDLPLTVSLSGPSAAEFSVDTPTIPPFGKVQLNVTYLPPHTGASLATVGVRSCASCTSTPVPSKGNAVPSAFTFAPSPVPFEMVPVHDSSSAKTMATNVTWRPVQIVSLATSNPAFVASNALASQQVGPGQSVQVDVTFDARTSGATNGSLSLNYTSDKARHSDVELEAGGGLPQSALDPIYLDFGDLPVGGKLARTVRLTNAGTVGDLHFDGVSAAGDTGLFGISEPQRGTQSYPWSAGSAWPTLTAPALPVAPGTDALNFQVYFEPEAPGTFATTLTFTTDDAFNPTRTVTATGHAHTSGPCTFQLTPTGMLDFGDVPAGWGAVLGFRFENVGTTECAVKDIHLGQDANGAFFMPGGPLVGGVLEPTDAFSAQVAFKSQTPGSFTGQLDITVNNPATPMATLPLEAWSYASCLAAAPNFIDFGHIRYDCPTQNRTTYVSNQCAVPVTVNGISIGAGTSNEFSVVTAPPTPVPMPPGPAGGFEVTVSFARSLLGQNFSPLFFTLPTEPQPFLVPLLGETNHSGFEVEDFIQGQPNQLDVLFVVSNTTTMAPYQQTLTSDVPGWLSQAAQLGVDLHAGVTTTGLVPKSAACPGGANGGEAGRLFPVNGATPRYITNTGGGATLSSDLQVGTCHDLVQGLETMRAALSTPLVDHPDDPEVPEPNMEGNLGLVRDAARMAVVFLSDDDDHSGFDPSSYIQFLQALKGPGMSARTSAWAIVPTDPSCQTAGAPGPRFTTVAQATGGQSLSVCASDYGGLLGQIIAGAAGLQRSFPLAATPTNPAAIVVTVDGQPAAAGAWTYDAASNAIVFAAGDAPQPGQDVNVQFEAACPPPTDPP